MSVLKRTKDKFEQILKNVGIESVDKGIFKPSKLFLLLTDNADSKNRDLTALSLCCFSQALSEHFGSRHSTERLIMGDYFFAQGIMLASKTKDQSIVAVLSRTIADIASGSIKEFSSLEECAALLAGKLLKSDKLERFKTLGRLVYEKQVDQVKDCLVGLGMDSHIGEELAT